MALVWNIYTGPGQCYRLRNRIVLGTGTPERQATAVEKAGRVAGASESDEP